MLSEYKGCNQHRTLVVMLSGILQAITLRCPTALIYSVAKCNTTDPTKSQVMGSPLDKLACRPSDLLHIPDDDETGRRNAEEVFIFGTKYSRMDQIEFVNGSP